MWPYPAKWVLSRTLANDYNKKFYSVYFNTIVWYFPKVHKLPFWTSNAILKKKQFQTLYFSEFVESYFQS